MHVFIYFLFSLAIYVALQAIDRTGKNGTFLTVARLGLELATIEVLFHEIGLCKATLSDKSRIVIVCGLILQRVALYGELEISTVGG